MKTSKQVDLIKNRLSRPIFQSFLTVFKYNQTFLINFDMLAFVLINFVTTIWILMTNLDKIYLLKSDLKQNRNSIKVQSDLIAKPQQIGIWINFKKVKIQAQFILCCMPQYDSQKYFVECETALDSTFSLYENDSDCWGWKFE